MVNFGTKSVFVFSNCLQSKECYGIDPLLVPIQCNYLLLLCVSQAGLDCLVVMHGCGNDVAQICTMRVHCSHCTILASRNSLDVQRSLLQELK